MAKDVVLFFAYGGFGAVAMLAVIMIIKSVVAWRREIDLRNTVLFALVLFVFFSANAFKRSIAQTRVESMMCFVIGSGLTLRKFGCFFWET